MTTDSTGVVPRQTDEPMVVYVREPKHWGRRILVFIGVMGLLLAAGFGLAAVNLFPKLRNPFATQVTDRSGPAVVESIDNLSKYVAAQGNFQVIVDYEEDRPYVPDFVSSYHVLFIAYGSVDAYVDFSGLKGDAVVVSADGKSIEITIPEPVLDEPVIDVDKSHVYSVDVGLLEVVKRAAGGDLNSQGQLYQLSKSKIQAAATETELIERAKKNTTAMLESFLKGLGYERVTVNYVKS
jgi:Protein of unknown function (DUF4230)